MPPRGYKINSLQKLIKPNHIIGGLTAGLPPIYLEQNWTGGKNIIRNRDASTLDDGAYLYLIEYSPATNQYYKQFVPIINLLENGARHFQLPTHTEGRVIVAAGELVKKGRVVEYNLESGTYTRNLMTVTNSFKINRSVYRNIVENAFRNARPTLEFKNQILAPQVPARLRNLLKMPPNKLSFLFGGKPTAALKRKPKYLSLSARNVLAQQHKRRVNAGESSNENSSPVRASPARRKRKANNGNPTGPAQVNRRR
jgi:hypothetical protein